MMIKKMIILSMIFYACMHNLLHANGWYNIILRNSTKRVIKPEELHVHTTQAGCPDIRNPNALQPGQEYSERQSKFFCAGACFDWFKVNDAQYYIPNQCGSSTIDVRQNGVYLNGSRARPYNCFSVIAWLTELGAKKIAMETALAALKAAEVFLEQVGKPVASTGTFVVRETAKGALTAGKEIAVGALSSTEDVASFLLTSIDIQKRHWDGTLQDFAQGRLGNVRVSGKIFNKDFDVAVDLDMRKPFDSIKNLAAKIVDIFNQFAQQLSNIKVGYQPVHIPDDMITLTLQRNTVSQSIFA
jgi:hypothetical protein